MEVINDSETTNLFKVKYNQDNSIKMQYAMHQTEDTTIEQYVYVEQTEETTNVVATNEVNGEKYEIVGKANDSHGVIFSNYTSNDVSYISTEYYDENGALLKHEQGFDSLDVFDESLTNLYTTFEQNEEVELKNLSTILSGFDHPESFTIEVPIEDAALAVTAEVDATLKVNDLETYDINYSYNNLFYTKENETFVSGDTLYHLTNQETLNDKVVLTYSALYQVPNGYFAPNDNEYYVVNKYMANYIEASAGYEIILENGVYKLLDLENEGKPGSKIDIEIKVEQYYSNDELVNVTMFQHTCDIQFDHLIFTKLDTVNNAKTDLELLYDQLVPTNDQMEQFNISIDTSMFE
jgi:hypothetical protein